MNVIHNGRISYATIAAAVSGDEDAIHAILRHYGRYIAHFSRCSRYDEYGNRYEYIDEDIKEQIEATYTEKILLAYDIYRLAPGEVLEE